jgi:hypothetical protein
MLPIQDVVLLYIQKGNIISKNEKSLFVQVWHIMEHIYGDLTQLPFVCGS